MFTDVGSVVKKAKLGLKVLLCFVVAAATVTVFARVVVIKSLTATMLVADESIIGAISLVILLTSSKLVSAGRVLLIIVLGNAKGPTQPVGFSLPNSWQRSLKSLLGSVVMSSLLFPTRTIGDRSDTILSKSV